MVEGDLVSLEHDDNPLLCDEDCVSDEEHAMEVVPEPVVDVVPEAVAEATPAVVQQDEQRRQIMELCLACRLLQARVPSVTLRLILVSVVRKKTQGHPKNIHQLRL